MKALRLITLLAIILLNVLKTVAQDVIVTVSPTQNVLPPQVLLYLSDPGKYFNITLTNTSPNVQQVYLGLQIEQTTPSSGLAISTPPNRQPQKPFVIQPNASYQLTTLEMKKLFNHIPASEISCPADLFSDYNNGSFGLLPEGIYQVHITAYRWYETLITRPEVVSNPTGGVCLFRICYNAQAPDFITPTLLGTADPSVAELDPLNAQFTWTTPVITCGSAFSSYTYDLRVVELLNGQQADYAIQHNPIVYQSKGLLAPTCIIPPNVITSKFYANQKYVAQITATPKSGNPLDYVLISNGGKSPLRVFRIKTDDEPEQEQVKEPESNSEQVDSTETEEEKEEEEEQEEEEDIVIIWGKEEVKDSINPDSLYTFRNPTLTSPDFLDFAARKIFTNKPLVTTWRGVLHAGGEGLQADTLRFSYEVQLFNNGQEANREEALKGTPIYTRTFTDEEDFKDSISWEFLEKNVQVGDYLVLRVKPTCINGSSVAFTNDSVNVLDFALIEPISKNYFECSNRIDIENTTPTSASASDLKGKTVAIGEYELTIDEIEEGKETDTWEGKGRVEWNPLGTTVMVCVEFSDLKINTDNQVFAGSAKTYSEPGKTEADVVDKLFSDWGIDNIFTDAGIPYAEEITKNKAKDIAKELDLSKYYSYVKKGQQVWNLLGKGNIDRLYFPIAIPKEVNESPVDLQIAGMNFSAEYATMNVIGQFTLPNSNYLKNDILVLGAPRLCISPENIIPEGGTVALLSDFGIKDPESSYEINFKAPKDLLHPTDGCYIAWTDYKFEIFGIDADMKIPGLKKDVNGVATNEMPVLNIRASFSEWEDWMIDNINMDAFQAEDLPGWTFTASDIVYDHSIYRNSDRMTSFPKNYDKSKVLTDGQTNTWQGLFIKKISVKMPKALEFGTSGDKRLEISADNMFFDKSGATLEIGASDILSAKTGKAGGWSFSLDRVNAKFIQNDFTHCGFSGKFDVPLLEGNIGYSCQILKVNNLQNQAAGNYAYVFKVQQVDQMKLDFFLATATFDKKLSYLLVEAVPEKTKLTTRVELLMGGDLTIGGTRMQNKIKSLPLDFNLPGIHFAKMRLANCKRWESQFEDIKEMQNAKDDKKILLKLYAGKEFNINNQFYFHTGEWSLASKSKNLGPFELSLDEFDFSYKNKMLELGIEGTVKLIEGIDLSASAGITIKAEVSGLSGVANFDFSKISFKYKETKFNKASFNSSFAGMKLKGSLEAKDDKTYGKGYSGSLEFTMPGDLFTAKATGGYYKKSNYRWGYFLATVGSATGIQIPPVTINEISAGFYFNCIRKSATQVQPEKDVIGVVAGLGIASSAGKETFNGKFEMTVVYDKAKSRLTTFMLTGDMSAVAGMIKSKATIVYHEDNTDKYFALNVTVDGQVDGGNIGGQFSQLTTQLSNLQKKLNKNMQSAVANVTGGLEGVISDQSTSKAKKTTNAKQPEKPKIGELKIALDLRVVMKEKGKKLNNVKWHLYLGEPDEDKRCKFTLIDFKSKIVSVNIGANAYLCIGNELPGDGELPPIPQKIRDFLNGSTKGSGVQSDDISKAENARTAALKDFQADVRGGVMLGASAWGYIDVDLGLFYGSLGALAGFDVSLRKLGNTQCMNLPRSPGYKGWYAEGQLYAYLYAKFGIYVNLGFWDKKFDIIDAGIGGVFRMGMPNPTYFTGEARVKLSLLNGLVNINRKFEFECGDRCDIFYGNALDNFRLFGDASVGDTIQSKGWDKKNAISPKFYVMPSFNTEAPIKEHFRVLDETELNRLAADFNGDKELLKSQASRTFVFNINNYVTLKEYDKNKKYLRTRTFYLKGNNRFQHIINLLELSSNRYYSMTVEGWAKEIEQGVEVNPLKWNEKKKKYENKAWRQTKTYYFCTGPSESIADCPEDLQKYVAIAYPSNYNQLKSTTSYSNAYVDDIESPNIAFFTDLSKQAFKKGKLKWRIYEIKNSSWSLLEEKAAYWSTTDSTCNLIVLGGSFNKKLSKNQRYLLKLDYDVSKSQNVQEKYYDSNTRSYKTRTVQKVTTTTTTLADMKVYAREGYYHTGYNGQSLSYEKPFLGIRLNSIKMKTSKPAYKPEDLSHYKKYMTSDGKNPARYADPYTYIAYMSNYGLIGGWRLTNERLSASATTSESLIYYDKGGSYAGKYSDSSLGSEYEKIKRLSIYDRSQSISDAVYPLPVVDDGKYSYFMGGNARAYKFNPAKSDNDRAYNLIRDLYDVYEMVDKFDSKFRLELQNLMYGHDGASTENRNAVQQMMEAKAGVYISQPSTWKSGNRIEAPYYHLGILWGSHIENKGSQKQVTMWGSFDDIPKSASRPHEKRCEDIVAGLVGTDPTKLLGIQHGIVTSYDKNKDKSTTSKKVRYIDYVPNYKNITEIKASYYRVNSYNFKKAEYTVSNGYYLNQGPVNAQKTITIKNPNYPKLINTNSGYYNRP